MVLAYGVPHPKLQHLADRMVAQIRQVKSQLWCFGLTKDGHPRHTLYLAGDTPLVPFERQQDHAHFT